LVSVGLLVLSSSVVHAWDCTSRLERVIAGDPNGMVPGTVYEVLYRNPVGEVTQDWIYAESGVLSWVQTGAPHVALGETWGHDRNCVWPVEAERDDLLY
jgi:hypothetical protein